MAAIARDKWKDRAERAEADKAEAERVVKIIINAPTEEILAEAIDEARAYLAEKEK